MTRPFFLMAALCAASFVSAAQSPGETILHGVDRSREAPVRRAVLAWPVSWDDSSLSASVLKAYRSLGYYRTAVDSVSADSSGGQVWVTEGKPTILDTLSLRGVSGEMSDVAAGALAMREGDPFVEATLEQDIQNVMAALGAAGYLDVRVETESIRETETDDAFLLSFDLVVHPGPVAVVDDVLFRGLRVTTKETAAGVSGLQPGDPWSSKAGEAARRRLSRTGIFTDVSGPELTMTGPGTVRVRFDVAEGRANSFDGVVGYLPPPSSAGTGTITGLVDVTFGNLFGTARRLHARWFQERQQRHEVGVTYREPMLGGWPLSAQLDLFQRRQDSTYVRQEGRIDLEAEVGPDMFAGLDVSASGTTPVAGYGQGILPQSSTLLAGARFTYDTRDRPVASRSGVLYTTMLHAGRKSSSFNGTSRTSGVQKVSFDAAFHYPVFPNQTLLLAAHWREVTGDGLDASDLYRLGGSSTLRGYRENEFTGTRLIWQTTEYRLFVSPMSYLGVFLDLAAIQSGSVIGGSASRSLIRAGYGVTSLVDTPIGSVGVSIAMGNGDGIGDAKLHVRLRTEF